MMKKFVTLLLVLLPFALSSFNSNAEDSPQHDEAFDYIKDRQSKLLQVERNEARFFLLRRSAVYVKIAHFLTVDPKADQYPGLNPYLYCAGNPIMFVDPTGKVIDYTSKLPYTAWGKYTSNADYLCEESHFFRTLLTKLDASATIIYITIGNTSQKYNDLPNEGYVNGQYSTVDKSIRYDNEDAFGGIMHNATTMAEETFHAYQQDNLELYEGKKVNFEFEAKVFAALVIYESGCGSSQSDAAEKVAKTIINKEMNINSKEFEIFYLHQCNNFIKEQKAVGETHKNYIAPNNSLPKCLMSIINSQDK